jgi:hypothetical protein
MRKFVPYPCYNPFIFILESTLEVNLRKHEYARVLDLMYFDSLLKWIEGNVNLAKH